MESRLQRKQCFKPLLTIGIQRKQCLKPIFMEYRLLQWKQF